MIGYYNECFQMAGDWLKLIILYHFRKMTSVSLMIIRSTYKKYPKLSLSYIHEMC